jgi:DNA-binding IclR family transcriptional regulator
MILPDDRILEHLAAAEEPLTPWMVAVDLDLPTGLVRARLDRLTHAEFVARSERDRMPTHFEITTWGIQYLDGDVDAHLRRPYPRPRPPHGVRPRGFVAIG